MPPFVSSKSVVEPCLADETNYQVTSEVKGVPCPFNSSKRGFQRRSFGLSHPVFVRDAALFFSKHRAQLETHFERSQISTSRPDFEGTPQRALKITPHAQLPLIRLKKLARSKYCLVTDISRCFPSIYTHSIPWALHTKSVSKTDRNSNSARVFGNRLDYILRQSQDGQTTGIPVGPDHSRVTAEIVLTAVDEEISTTIDPMKSIRHVDDYWIGGDSYEDCDNSLQILRGILSDYSLDINEQKTRIVQTNNIISESWPYHLENQLENVILSEKPAQQAARLVSILGNIVEYSSSSQDDGIIKFFLRRLDNWSAWNDHWETLEPFLAHCAVQFPHSFDYVSQIVVWRIRTARAVDAGIWKDVSEAVLKSATRSGRDAEVLWSLWFLKELGESISGDIAKDILANNGPLVAATLPHLADRGLITGGFDLPSAWEKVESSPLAGPCWPLSLELSHFGVRRPRAIVLDGPAALTGIFEAKCSLFDWDRHPQVFLDDDDELDEAPTHALGQMGSDYDDDDPEDEYEGTEEPDNPDF